MGSVDDAFANQLDTMKENEVIQLKRNGRSFVVLTKGAYDIFLKLIQTAGHSDDEVIL